MQSVCKRRENVSNIQHHSKRFNRKKTQSKKPAQMAVAVQNSNSKFPAGKIGRNNPRWIHTSRSEDGVAFYFAILREPYPNAELNLLINFMSADIERINRIAPYSEHNSKITLNPA